MGAPWPSESLLAQGHSGNDGQAVTAVPVLVCWQCGTVGQVQGDDSNLPEGWVSVMMFFDVSDSATSYGHFCSVAHAAQRLTEFVTHSGPLAQLEAG